MKFKSTYAAIGLVGVLTACQQSDTSSGSGMLRLDLQTNGQVNAMRAVEDTEMTLPNVNDFSLAVLKGETVLNTWSSFEDCPEELVFPVGSYTAKAWYGDIEQEGFDLPVFGGNTLFDIADNEKTQVQVTCYLENVKATLSYSPSFASYFSNYKASLSSSKQTPIIFTADETRAAYLKPGSLDLKVNVTNPQGTTADLAVANIPQTQGRSHYHFTLDVDAGTGMMYISFDSTTVKEPVTIDISNESLTALPPVFNATGMTADGVVEHTEYMTPALSSLSMMLHAKAGIRDFALKTTSPFLLENGFPEVLDFATMTNEQLAALKNEWGLNVRGVGQEVNVHDMAYVDLMNFVAKLQHLEENATHHFTFTAVDRNGHMAEDFSFDVLSNSDQFAAFDTDTVFVGSTQANLSIQLDGDPKNVSFAYLNDLGEMTACTSTEVVASQDLLQTIQVDGLHVTNKPLKVVAYYHEKQSDTLIVDVKSPAYSLSVPAADSWATKAYVNLHAEDADLTNNVLTYATYDIRKAGEETWTPISADAVNGKMSVAKLEANTSYEIRSTCLPEPAESDYTEIASFTTEKALQTPNAGFEIWHSNKTDRNGKEVGNTHRVYWDKYFPYKQGDTAPRWSTMNEKTTQDAHTPVLVKWINVNASPYYGCRYVVNSGTIPAERSEGNKVAIIRSVGYAVGSKADGSDPEKTEAGRLFLGVLGSNFVPDYGIAFASRPEYLQFTYKYAPHNEADLFTAKIVVMGPNEQIIGQATMPSAQCGKQDAYKVAKVKVNYTVTDVKAESMYIEFVSGSKLGKNETDFAYPPFANLTDGEFVGAQLFVDDVQLIY